MFYTDPADLFSEDIHHDLLTWLGGTIRQYTAIIDTCVTDLIFTKVTWIQQAENIQVLNFSSVVA